MQTEMRVEDVDLTDVDMFLNGDPFAAFRVLRNEAPVHWQERSWGTGFWNITKYDDVMQVSVDPTTFISGAGIIVDNDGKRMMREERLRKAGGNIMDPRGNMMIMTDPPRHTFMRQLVNKGFTHKSVLRMEPHIRTIVTRILDEVCERGECDFVLDIARKLPLEVICELVGVPEGDWEQMFEISNRVIGVDDPEYGPQTDEMTPEEMEQTGEFFNYFMSLINERRESPTEDVLSILVHSEIDGQRLADHELFLFFLLLIIAGNETTRNATSGGMLALIEHPDQLARVQQDPSLTLTAVEEIVRWTSPVMHFTRRATCDTEIRGVQISEGQDVCLWYPSANRDEAVFEDGETFRIDRDPNPHIAFGKGEHFCLGANLARLELKVIFDEIAKRLPDIELAGPPERLRSNFIGGIKRMPVRFTPSHPAA